MKKTYLAIFAVHLFIIPWCKAEDSLTFISRTILNDYPWGVAKRGNYLYVPNRGTISIVDISDPDNPIFVKNHDPNTNATAVFIVDTILYCKGSTALATVNISNAENPFNLSRLYYGSATDGPRGIYVYNNKCYISQAYKGFTIFDVTDPTLPESVNTYKTPVSARDVYISDTILYIADYDSLQIVNVTNPNSCFRINAVGMHWGCTGIAVHDNYAYCAMRGDWGTDGRIISVDVSNPANPIKVDSIYAIMGNPITAYYANGRIYSIAADYFAGKGKECPLPIGCKEKADIEGGVRVINATNPDSIYYTCGFNTFSDPRDAIADSQYVYIADQDSGLIILRHNHYTGVEGKPYELNLANKMHLSFCPNPANRNVNITYTVPEQGNVSIKIYNLAGQEVIPLVGDNKVSGRYSISWNGKAATGQSVSSNIYICRYALNGKITTQKLIVIK